MENDALNRLIEVLIQVAIVHLVIIILSVRRICLTVCPYRLCCVTDLDATQVEGAHVVSAVLPSSEYACSERLA